MAIAAYNTGTAGGYVVNSSGYLQTSSGLYRINSWNGISNSTSNTYPINGWSFSSATTAITTQCIEYSTLDNPYTIDGTTGLTYYTQAYYSPPIKTAAERLKEILNSRMGPNIISSCKPLEYSKDVREMRARETLRRVLGEEKFKDFVRRGSVSVRAKSGLMYQIFPGSDFTNVYDCGKMVDRLCVVLQGGFPPTDSLIMRYLMLLNNEQQFRSYAIKQGIVKPVVAEQPDQRSLVEIFKELKAA